MSRRAAAAAVALVLVAAGAGCGQDGDGQRTSSPAGEVKPLGFENAGSVVQFADCGDWRRGSRAERMVTVEHLRGQLTPQRSASAASPLRDEHAYQLLDKACTPQYASSLRLYKLYVKMQGFAPLRG